MTKDQTDKMNRFIDALMAKMTLEDKAGQLSQPNWYEPNNTTGAATQKRDIYSLARAGQVGMTGRGDIEKAKRLQEIAVKESAHGIPIAFTRDVIHGSETAFPINLGLACTWDMGLIEKTARVAATEAATTGVNVNWAPMVDICEDARWGRAAEGAGEDPYLGARIAEAMVKGFQGDDLSAPDTVAATAKHFAAYGFVKAGRDYSTVDMSAYKFHNTVLPPFCAAVKAGVSTIMVAFNDISGIAATAHKELLDDLLVKRVGFKGNLATDYTAIEELMNHGVAKDMKEAAYLAFRAGINIDLVSEAFSDYLPELVREGRISENDLDKQCRKVLELKYRLGLFEDPLRYFNEERRRKVVLAPEHRALAREAAAKSCVLLKNEGNILPLKKEGLTIALVGPLAAGEDARANMQGTWAVGANPDDSVTVMEGIQNVAGEGVQVKYIKGANITDDPDESARLDVHNRHKPTAAITGEAHRMRAQALSMTKGCDIIVACVGEAKEHSGESSWRTEIGLPGSQLELIRALKSTGKPLVLVTMSGRPLSLEWENENADAILHAWFAGTEAGNGIADVLFGDVNPSGKLTMSFPRTAGQCPISYTDPPTGRPREKIGIDVFGDTEKDKNGMNVFRKFTTACRVEGPHTPLYPFGYGLSYTDFEYGPLSVNKTALKGGKDVLRASVTVKNTGKVAGDEIVQLYITDPVASMVRPMRELKGFEKITLQPGEEKQVTFEITPEDLKFYKASCLSKFRHVWEEGEFIIQVGRSSEDLQAVSIQWEKDRKVTPKLQH